MFTWQLVSNGTVSITIPRHYAFAMKSLASLTAVRACDGRRFAPVLLERDDGFDSRTALDRQAGSDRMHARIRRADPG